MKHALTTTLSAMRKDVQRHGGAGNPACWPLLVYRFGRLTQHMPAPARAVASRAYGLMRLGLKVTIGTAIERETMVGEGLHLVHFTAIHVHPDVVLGDRVRLNHDVTIGLAHNRPGAPRLGNDVLVGAGAKIIGPVTIGDGAVIAANSLVVTDVPAGATAIGVPARAMPVRTVKASNASNDPAASAEQRSA